LPQEGARGLILDRNGECLAGNSLSYNVAILPQERGQLDKTFETVSGILGVDVKEIKTRFKKGYIAPFIPVVVGKNIDIKKAIALGELRWDCSNVIIQPMPLRNYPHGKLASHVLGYLNEIDHWRLTKLEDYGYKTKDIVGFGGIEEKYDYYLRQEEGALSIEVDHRGKFMRVLGFRPPCNGKNIRLTLDLKIQKIVEDSLENKKGSVILMDPYTGEILAMASNPNFDPSLFINKLNGALNSLEDSALVNRAISGLSPPASVFKLVAACAGLETGKINVSTVFFCPGHTRVGNREFACWETHNDENLTEAIAHSCDVFFYKTGLLLGPQTLHDYAIKFGLSKLTGVDLPYEAGGIVPDPLWKRVTKLQSWYDGDTANFVIGQGYLLVTPLQIARLMAVFANKGILVTPYIVKNIAGKDMSVAQKKNSTVPLKQSILQNIKQDLMGVISETTGTANVLADLPVPVAGKTGTAQVSRNQTNGWFSGFFPATTPKFVICVFLENNASGHTASALTRQILEGMIKENLI
jgi:penicillin-binding protein 2